jgi:hypothetical protein
VIRIEGPILGKDVARRLGEEWKRVAGPICDLFNAGLVSVDYSGYWLDVTPRGRLKFTALHRPKRSTILARLKARAGWRK